MHSGVVLVLKWYLLVYRFTCCAGPVVGSTKGASARYTALGDDVEPRRTRFFRDSYIVSPMYSGHNKKRHRLCQPTSFPASWPGKCLTPVNLVDPRKMMEQFKQPAQEPVQPSHTLHQSEHKTPPSIEEIRRQLGWDLCHASTKSTPGA